MDLNFVFEPLTWEILELDLQGSFKTTAKFGPNRKAVFEEIHGGFVSQVVFVTFDWIGDNCEQLPKKSVIKVTTGKELQKAVERHLPKDTNRTMPNIGAIINDNELNFYKNCKKWGLDREFVVRFYAGRVSGDGISAGYIALEWIDGMEAEYQYDCVPEESFRDILKMTAIIHTRAMLNPGIIDDIKRNVPETIDILLFSAQGVCDSIDHVSKDQPQRKDQIEFLKKFAQIFGHRERIREIKKQNCSLDLLCHGDLTLANFLWEKSDGSMKPKILLDWQMNHIGNPLTDLSRLFTISLSPQLLQFKRNEFLEFYYEQLKIEAGTAELPWKSKEELIDSFERIFPIEVINLIGMIVPIVDLLLRTCPESEKEQRSQEFRQKLYGALDLCELFIRKCY